MTVSPLPLSKSKNSLSRPQMIGLLILCFGLCLGGISLTRNVQARQDGRPVTVNNQSPQQAPDEAVSAPSQTEEDSANLVAVPNATFTVSNTSDSGAGSLRNAVAAAAAGDTIDFGGLTTPATITLTSGQIEITKNLIILGPG